MFWGFLKTHLTFSHLDGTPPFCSLHVSFSRGAGFPSLPQADAQRPGDLERACPSPTLRSFSKARPEKSCVASPSWTPTSKRLTPHQSCLPLAGDIRHLKVAITGHGDMSTAQSKAMLSKSQGNKHSPISDHPITDLPGATEKASTLQPHRNALPKGVII